MEDQKIVLGLVPRKPSVPEIVAYIDDLVKLLPNLKVIVSLQGPKWINEDLSPLVRHPAVVGWPGTSCSLKTVAGGYNIMSMARTMEVDWVFFNLGMFRYSPKEVVKFVFKTFEECYGRAQMTYGKPPDILLKSASKEELLALKKPNVRSRLVVDYFINYVYSRALDTKYSNANAGLIAVTMRAVKYLLSISNYDDSSLLCPQMIWHLKRSCEGFKILPVDVGKVNLGHLGFNADHAIHELVFVLTQVGYAGRLTDSATGQWTQIQKIASEFFAEREEFNRWIVYDDEKWFFEKIVPPLEDKLRKYVKKTSA